MISSPQRTGSPISILRDPNEVLRLIGVIQAEADSQRESLGFLPQDAYRQAAVQGKIIVAVENPTGESPVYAGHIMFGGSPPTLRVFQLFVKPNYRRNGVGSLLVEALVALAENDCYLSIVARVAEDLSHSNVFWEHQGFLANRTCLGGKARNRLIIVREKRLNTPTLFDLVAVNPEVTDHDLRLTDRSFNRSPAYGIDLNVLLDLVRDRPRASAASRIFSSALSNTIRLFVAPEFVLELRRAKELRPDVQDDTLLEFAMSLPQHPPPPSSAMTALGLELAALIFPERSNKDRLRARDRSDVKHIATAIHNRVAGYVTSEEAILRRRSVLLEKYGLDVVAPTELAESLAPGAWEEPDFGTTRPERCAETRIADVDECTSSAARALLVRLGAPAQIIDHACRKGALQSPRRRLLLSTQDTSVAFLSWDPPNRATTSIEAFFFVDASANDVESIVDQALFLLVQDACKAFPVMIRLCLHPNAGWLQDLTGAFGFRQVHREDEAGSMVLQKLALGQTVTEDNWGATRDAVHRLCKVQIPESPPRFVGPSAVFPLISPAGANLSISLSEFEELVCPALFALPGRPGAIVPIRRQFSSELLHASSQAILFSRFEAGVRGKRAYFCSPRALTALSPGTLLFFYESMKNDGRGAIVACARSVEIFVKPKSAVASTLLTRGVLDEQQLAGISHVRDVGVVVFDSVMRFQKPIGLASVREMGCADGSNIVTARRIDSTKVAALLALGEPCV